MRKKSEKELRKMHWRDRYAYEAELEMERLLELDEKSLLARIQANRLDSYFAIWRSIGRVGTVECSAPILWEFLKNSPGDNMMLHRYHCAAALFQILGLGDPASQNELRKRVQWDHQGEDARQAALLELNEVIKARMESGG